MPRTMFNAPFVQFRRWKALTLVLGFLDRLEADFLTQLADIQEEARQAMVKQEEGQFERRFEQMRERMEGSGRRPEREEPSVKLWPSCETRQRAVKPSNRC